MGNKIEGWSTILIFLLIICMVAACASSSDGGSSAAAEGQTRANANLVGPVCQGTPLPEAPAYSETTGAHSLVIVELGRDGAYRYGFIDPDAYSLPDGWRASYVEGLQLVVCVDAEEDELVETCEYTMADGSGTAVMSRYAKKVTFRLVEAATGREIATETLTGLPRYCREREEFLEGTDGGSLYGQVYEEMENWLRPFVEIP